MAREACSESSDAEIAFSSQCSVDSDISQTGSPEQAVQRALQVWLAKPQVANRRLFGSQLREGSIAAVTSGLPTPARLVRTLVPRNPALASATEAVEWRPEAREWRFEAQCSREGYRAAYCVRLAEDAEQGEAFEVRLEELHAPEDGAGWIFERAFFSTDLTDRLTHWYNQALLPSAASSAPLSSPMALVDVERYVALHRGLKAKYGRQLIANWSEKTDAQKFVFEDLAIAAYLLALWDEERESVRFADLGCGNGLLVHLLVSEGVHGVGLDVRRRGIWARFPPATSSCLLEASLDPSSPSCATALPAGTNWLIGNHSDELTPWLPVLAARLSPSCAFFVLPCCPHDLFGKFADRGKGVSRYRTYLDFVGALGARCGFRVKSDLLRIPSTRRSAWVGRPQGLPRAQQLQEVAAAVQERQGQRPDFAARPAVEPVRNCSQVSVELRSRVMQAVFSELLLRGEPKRARLEGKAWNPGGRMTLAEVSRLFDRQLLQQLKAQHGGLQTLLRNQHQAFEVRGGVVEIRKSFKVTKRGKEATEKEKLKVERRKTKLCWMLENHPDGCPRPDQDCPFSHNKEDAPKHS